MKSLALALLTLVSAQEGHISGAAYWFAERAGRLQSAEVREGIIHVSIFEHHGPVRGWLTVAERDDPEGKERGTIWAVHNLMVFIRSTLGSERAHGVEKLRALTGLELEPYQWLRWFDENGDFLSWSESEHRLLVDEARKRSGTPRAVEGLRVRLSTDKREYLPSEPIWVTLRLENASPEAIPVRGDFRIGEEWSLELRRHRPDDVAYHHFRELELGGPERVELRAGAALERSYDHGARLEAPLATGPYSIGARYRIAPGVEAASVTRFFEVLNEAGRRSRLFKNGLSFSGGELDWEAVERALEGIHPALERCFDGPSAGSPIPGRLEVEWTLARDGTAREVSVEDETLASPAVAACLARALTGLPFPVPREGRPQLSYELTFVP